MTTKCFHCGCGHESKECPTYGGVAPRVGDVWRWQHDPRVAYLVEKIGDDTVDGRFVEDPTARYQGPQSIKARYFRDVYTFDAEATAKAMAAANCQAAVDVVLAGTTLAGPPRAELPDNPSEALAAALTSIADGLAVNAAIDRLADFARAIGEYAYSWQPDPSQPTTTLRGESARSACPRCAGPAYTGLLSVECLRPGGCKTASERVDEECPYPLIAAAWRNGECALWVEDLGIKTRLFPTSDMALAAWREAAIAAERGK
jgi:hypothetical protein